MIDLKRELATCSARRRIFGIMDYNIRRGIARCTYYTSGVGVHSYIFFGYKNSTAPIGEKSPFYGPIIV